MNTEYLVKMANQIGQFFAAEPDAKQAECDIAAHLKRFWDPRMRQALLGYVAQGGNGLLPIVLQAVRNHHDKLA